MQFSFHYKLPSSATKFTQRTSSLQNEKLSSKQFCLKFSSADPH